MEPSKERFFVFLLNKEVKNCIKNNWYDYTSKYSRDIEETIYLDSIEAIVASIKSRHKSCQKKVLFVDLSQISLKKIPDICHAIAGQDHAIAIGNTQRIKPFLFNKNLNTRFHRINIPGVYWGVLIKEKEEAFLKNNPLSSFERNFVNEITSIIMSFEREILSKDGKFFSKAILR